MSRGVKRTRVKPEELEEEAAGRLASLMPGSSEMLGCHCPPPPANSASTPYIILDHGSSGGFAYVPVGNGSVAPSLSLGPTLTPIPLIPSATTPVPPAYPPRPTFLPGEIQKEELTLFIQLLSAYQKALDAATYADTPKKNRNKTMSKRKEEKERKKDRTNKWYEDTPFADLLDYDNKRTMEFAGSKKVEKAEEVKAGRKEVTYAFLTRYGIHLKNSFADFILSRIGRQRNNGEQFLYVCTDFEVKKLSKTSNTKFLVCECENARLTRKERKDKQDKTPKEDVMKREEIKVVALLWVEPEKTTPKRRKSSPSKKRSRTDEAAKNERNDKLFMITDPAFISDYMEPWSKEMFNYRKFRDLWDSTLGHEDYDFSPLDSLEVWQQQKNGKQFSSDFELSDSVKPFVAPCGVVFRNAWCDLVAHKSDSLMANLDSKEMLEIITTTGKRHDSIRTAGTAENFDENMRVKYVSFFNEFFD